jgi:hypothetical protein
VADLTLKERARRRLEGLKQNRQSFEQDWKEIASYALPARSRFLANDTNKGRQRNRKLNNSHGIFAFRTLQGGMTSGLSSQSRPWFQLTTYDPGLAEDAGVKAWLGVVQERIESFIAHTNFYGAAKTGYLEMGAFGTEACVMLDHSQEGAVCHALTAGEYWIGLNDAMMPGALYRECVMTVIQAVETFGYKNVRQAIRDAYDRSRYDEQHCFYHAIEENDDHVAGKLGPEGKPWRSIYWDEADGSKDGLVSLSGYDEQPFWAPRWDTTGNDAWGQGPGHDALPDLRELQLQTKRKAEATDMHIWPEIVSTATIKLKRQPKSVVSAPAADLAQGKGVVVPYQVPYEAIGAVREDINDLKGAINQATYADLFMAISNMDGVQPRNMEEIAARNEEKLTQLGPVIERVNNEKLQVAIERVFGIMQRARLLPPAPDALRNAPDIKIEFVSILTQMQRMVGAGQIERGVQFVGGLTGMYPSARFKLDSNAMIDKYARIIGMPADLIRPTQDAENDAEAEAAAAQNAQAAEAAAKLGKPIKDVTDAATLAAQLPVAGTPAVQDLTGQQ